MSVFTETLFKDLPHIFALRQGNYHGNLCQFRISTLILTNWSCILLVFFQDKCHVDAPALFQQQEHTGDLQGRTRGFHERSHAAPAPRHAGQPGGQIFWRWPLRLLGEVAIGITIGLAVQMLFAGIQMAGQLVGFQMSFSIANIMDPGKRNAGATAVAILPYPGHADFPGHQCPPPAAQDTLPKLRTDSPPGVSLSARGWWNMS